MLISFLLFPKAFGCAAIDSKASRQAAEMVLKDILSAGIIIDYAGRPSLDAIEKEIEQLRPELNQRLLILLEEVKKQKAKVVATPTDTNIKTLDSLVNCMKPDAAILPPTAQAPVRNVPENITVTDYLDSSSRTALADCLSPKIPAAHFQAAELAQLLGRFLKYARTITLMDKMMGRATKDKALPKRFVDGIAFVVNCWKTNTVYTREKLELVVVTVAGDCSSGGGYVDPSIAEKTISKALVSLDVALKIDVKQDSSPSLFHARYIKAKGRCIKIDPGIDSLSTCARCPCLQLDPPTEAITAIATHILRLPSANGTPPHPSCA